MKLIFIALTLYVAAVVAKPSGEWMESIKKCMEKEGITEQNKNEIFGKMKQGDAEVPKEAKCFHACMLESSKQMTSDGKFNKDASKAFMSKMLGGDEEKLNKALEIFKTCEEQASKVSERCEKGFTFSKCYRAKMHEAGLGRKKGKKEKKEDEEE